MDWWARVCVDYAQETLKNPYHCVHTQQAPDRAYGTPPCIVLPSHAHRTTARPRANRLRAAPGDGGPTNATRMSPPEGTACPHCDAPILSVAPACGVGLTARLSLSRGKASR